MAFSICYIQFVYISWSYASTRNSYSYHWDEMFKEMLGNCVAVFVLGNFIFLFFEAPMFNLFVKYTGFKRRSQTEKIQNKQASNGHSNGHASQFHDEKCKAA